MRLKSHKIHFLYDRITEGLKQFKLPWVHENFEKTSCYALQYFQQINLTKYLKVMCLYGFFSWNRMKTMSFNLTIFWCNTISCTEIQTLNNRTETNCAKPKPNRLPIYGFEDTLNYYVHLLLTKYFLAKNQIMCRRQMIFFQSSFFFSDVILSRNPYLSTAQRQKCH